MKTLLVAAGLALALAPLSAEAAKRQTQHRMHKMMIMMNGKMTPLMIMVNGRMEPVYFTSANGS